MANRIGMLFEFAITLGERGVYGEEKEKECTKKYTKKY